MNNAEQLGGLQGDYIGRFVNKWRGRTVAIYEHTKDPESVITVGRPFDGSDPVICAELKKDWAATLRRIKDADRSGRIYVYE